MLWQPGQTVLFTGDSITDCGRFDPATPFGSGYVQQVVDLVTARYPEHHLRFINTGIGGNTVADLTRRWDDDVLAHQPDWVSVMIGINDLHQTLGGVPGLAAEAYEPNLDRLLARTVEAGARLMLLDPFYLRTRDDATPSETTVLDRLDGYLAAVERLAAKHDAVHVPTQAAWLRVLAVTSPDSWCPEPVHPTARGHLVISNAVLEAIGF